MNITLPDEHPYSYCELPKLDEYGYMRTVEYTPPTKWQMVTNFIKSLIGYLFGMRTLEFLGLHFHSGTHLITMDTPKVFLLTDGKQEESSYV